MWRKRTKRTSPWQELPAIALEPRSLHRSIYLQISRYFKLVWLSVAMRKDFEEGHLKTKDFTLNQIKKLSISEKTDKTAKIGPEETFWQKPSVKSKSIQKDAARMYRCRRLMDLFETDFGVWTLEPTTDSKGWAQPVVEPHDILKQFKLLWLHKYVGFGLVS